MRSNWRSESPWYAPVASIPCSSEMISQNYRHDVEENKRKRSKMSFCYVRKKNARWKMECGWIKWMLLRDSQQASGEKKLNEPRENGASTQRRSSLDCLVWDIWYETTSLTQSQPLSLSCVSETRENRRIVWYDTEQSWTLLTVYQRNGFPTSYRIPKSTLLTFFGRPFDTLSGAQASYDHRQEDGWKSACVQFRKFISRQLYCVAHLWHISHRLISPLFFSAHFQF